MISDDVMMSGGNDSRVFRGGRRGKESMWLWMDMDMIQGSFEFNRVGYWRFQMLNW